MRRTLVRDHDRTNKMQPTIFICEQQELGHVGFWLPPNEVAELEKKEKADALSGRDKARLQSHRQSKPYAVAKAGE